MSRGLLRIASDRAPRPGTKRLRTLPHSFRRVFRIFSLFQISCLTIRLAIQVATAALVHVVLVVSIRIRNSTFDIWVIVDDFCCCCCCWFPFCLTWNWRALISWWWSQVEGGRRGRRFWLAARFDLWSRWLIKMRKRAERHTHTHTHAHKKTSFDGAAIYGAISVDTD